MISITRQIAEIGIRSIMWISNGIVTLTQLEVLSQIAECVNLRLFEGEPIMAAISFKGRHFQQDMILQSVRWYLGYCPYWCRNML